MKGLIATATAVAMLSIASVAVAAPATNLTGTSERSGATLSQPATVTAVHGTSDGPLGKGTYEGTLTGGSSFTSPDCQGVYCQPVTGSITFSGHRGSFTGVVQPGSVVGIYDIHPRVATRTFTLTLRVAHGTRGYANAGGLLTLSYTSTFMRFFDDNFQLITTISDSRRADRRPPLALGPRVASSTRKVSVAPGAERSAPFSPATVQRRRDGDG